MNFLNLGLVLGATAFLAPLLIHIFNRSRFRVVQWGAMHLLESVLRVNRKQVQLEQIILLIIRCAIPILLALCLARMVVTDWSAFIHRILLPLSALGFLILVALFPRLKTIFGVLCAACLLFALVGELGLVGGGYAGKKVTSKSMEIPSSSVVLLDDSFSMNANGGFEKASSFTEGFLKKLRKGSEASVVRMGGSPTPLFPKPTSETETLGERSGQLLASYDQLDLAGSLESGLAKVSTGINAKRELIVLSDFRKSDWADTGNSFLNLRKRLESEDLKPALTFIDVGGPAEENLSVEKVELSAYSIGVGQKVLVRAELRNHGNAKYEGDLLVRLFVNEESEPIDETAVSLDPGEIGQVLFAYKFEEAGSSILTVEIGVRDALDKDNRRSVSLTVLDRIGVLLIDGSPSKEWLGGETDFLKLALTPFEEDRKGRNLETKDLIDATVVKLADFNPSQNLENDTKVVVLANAAKVNEAQAEALFSFVLNGGGLWLCHGDQVDGQWYNDFLGPEGTNLLPLRLRNLGGSLTDDSIRTRVVATHFDHPALSLFNDPRNGNLADADIWRWRRLEEPENALEQETTILARFETGDPFLAERKTGKGLVLQMSTSVDGDWNNLPVRASYLPLVQQIASYLANQVTPPRNLSTGSTITHYLPEREAGSSFDILCPDGSVVQSRAVRRGSQSVVEFSNTRHPGVYQISGNGFGPVKFVANASPRESMLGRMDPDDIRKRLETLTEKVDFIETSEANPLSQYLEIDRARTFGRETWKLLLAVVLGLVLLEVILQRIFGRGRA
jgi:hypothetical protein